MKSTVVTVNSASLEKTFAIQCSQRGEYTSPAASVKQAYEIFAVLKECLPDETFRALLREFKRDPEWSSIIP